MVESIYFTDNTDLLNKLGEFPTLKHFDKKDLVGLLNLSKVIKYKPGDLILEEGKFDNRIFFLLSGKVKVTKEGKELSVLNRRGDLFGEMGIIEGLARSASVYAIDETVCLETDASYMDRLSGDDKVAFTSILYRIFAEILANRLRATDKELVSAKEEISRLKSELSK